jgi:hypothetical protein
LFFVLKKDIGNAKAKFGEILQLVKDNERIWAKYLATTLTAEEAAALAKIKGRRHKAYVEALA